MSPANGKGVIFETDVDRQDWKAISRGWCLGPPKFKASLLKRLDGKLGPHHSGKLRQETSAAKAERIITEELKRLKWKEAELGQRAKSDPLKLALAARLRRETTQTLPWIALRLHMGTWKSLNAKLHRWRKANERPTQGRN
jgi:hypothetical protein